MGVMRFLAHPPELFQDWPEVKQAYLSGFDGRVFPTRIEVDGNEIICRRHASDSGKFHICWPLEGVGRPVVHTCSLPERREPYLLPLELARGKISEIRDQLGAWQIAGMVIPKDFFPLQKQAQKLLGSAAQRQDSPRESGPLAQEALSLAVQPVKAFMLSHTRDKDLALFAEYVPGERAQTPQDLSLAAVIPAFMINELRIAFQIGFMLYLPMLLIDMVVSAVLMSMGMMMLPPVMISMPFKILLFVLVDGWYLIVESIITGLT